MQIPVSHNDTPEVQQKLMVGSRGRSGGSGTQNLEGLHGMPVQAKLAIGQPDDKYEREADRVASQVVEQIDAQAKDQSVQGQTVQRKLEDKEEEIQNNPKLTAIKDREGLGEKLQRKLTIQGKDGSASGEVSSELTSAINSARGGGQPLDAGLQQSMGRAMGADFSGVRVHTDARSDRLNKSLQAKAFTTGQDVFFRQGEYQPGTRVGNETIAHELTHVVQQQRKKVMAKTETEEKNRSGEIPPEKLGSLGERERGTRGRPSAVAKDHRPEIEIDGPRLGRLRPAAIEEGLTTPTVQRLKLLERDGKLIRVEDDDDEGMETNVMSSKELKKIRKQLQNQHAGRLWRAIMDDYVRSGIDRALAASMQEQLEAARLPQEARETNGRGLEGAEGPGTSHTPPAELPTGTLQAPLKIEVPTAQPIFELQSWTTEEPLGERKIPTNKLIGKNVSSEVKGINRELPRLKASEQKRQALEKDQGSGPPFYIYRAMPDFAAEELITNFTNFQESIVNLILTWDEKTKERVKINQPERRSSGQEETSAEKAAKAGKEDIWFVMSQNLGHLGDYAQAAEYVKKQPGMVLVRFQMKPHAENILYNPANMALPKRKAKGDKLAPIRNAYQADDYWPEANPNEGTKAGYIGVKPEEKGPYSLVVGENLPSLLLFQLFVARADIVEVGEKAEQEGAQATGGVKDKPKR